VTRRLSRRAASLEPSSTAAVARAAKALAAAGVSVVDFGLGEPDFDTPPFVARAGVEAIEKGRTRYTDTAGTPALREAIAQKYRREQSSEWERENVLVTAGAKQAVFNACQVLFDEGDAVAIFSPYWVSFPEMVRLAGAQPVPVPTRLETQWKPTAEALARHAPSGTRGVILNSPNNPTGAVVEPKELERILEWCAARDATLVFDETYDRFLYDGRRHVSAASFWERHAERIVVTGAASKTYAMTGWRLGWALGPRDVVSAMASYQSHSTSNASSISQEAALAALTDREGSEACVAEMLAQYSRRREAMVRGLSRVAGVRCGTPEGAFYAFAEVSPLYGPMGVAGSAGFCERLLQEANVAAVPGDAFGADDCVRFSFATSVERIEEGVGRVAEWAARARSG
jgi:aspartate aminotransferase